MLVFGFGGFLEDEVIMHLDNIMSRAGSFAQSSNSPRKTINGCEKVGECGMRNLGLDELIIRQLRGSKMEPCEGATALGSIVLLQTGCQLQGLLSVIEGMSCFPDFSSLASVICLFAKSSMELSVELFIRSPPLSVRRNTWTWLNIQLLTESLQAGFIPSVTQRKAKQNHAWIRLLQRRGGKREIWAAAMPELRPVFILSLPSAVVCWDSVGDGAHRNVPLAG